MAYEFFNKWAVEFIALLMKDFNLDLHSAVAIVGNAGHESGGFKQLQELKPLVAGSKGGWGIMQWTGPRRREAEAYWKRNNLNPSDMMANYKFLYVELKGSEGKALAALIAAPTLELKVESFCNRFLRPGIPHMDSRKVWAKRALEAWERSDSDQPSLFPTQKPAESVPTPAPSASGLWWLKLLLSLVRAFIRGGK